MLALTGCSSDGDDSNNLLEQEVDPSTRTGESAFMKTFVGNYWDVVEYGVVMDDGTKDVAFDEEGPKNLNLARVQGGDPFPGIKVLNDSVTRIYFTVYMVGEGHDGDWYVDRPVSYEDKTKTLSNNFGGWYSDRLKVVSFGEDYIRLNGEWRFDTFLPNVDYSYFVLRKMSEQEGIAKYGKHKKK